MYKFTGFPEINNFEKLVILRWCLIDTYYNIELTAGTNGAFFIAYECTYNNAGKVGVYIYTPAAE